MYGAVHFCKQLRFDPLFTAEDESGSPPFETTLRIEGSFSFTQEPSISYDGPGVVVKLDGPVDNEYKVSITTVGIYFFTAEVTYEGATYTDTIAIQVLDQVELDVLLKAKWEEMKSSLIDNNLMERVYGEVMESMERVKP